MVTAGAKAVSVPDRLCVIADEKLASDIAYLMVGIASETFPYDEAARSILALILRYINP